VASLLTEDRAVDYVWNSTAYDREGGDTYSGWCSFEQGVCTAAAAHFSAAERQATGRGHSLPHHLAVAQASRPKVTDISGGEIRPREISESPQKLLEATVEAIKHAKFVGKGDKPLVQQMLAEIEWTMKMAMEQAEQAQNAHAHDLSIDPRRLRSIAVHPSQEPSDLR